MTTTTTTDMNALADEWVKKLQFEKRVDLNLQLTVPGESSKVQVNNLPPLDLPSMSDQQDLTALFNKEKPTPHLPVTPPATTPAPGSTTDSYLQSIVSSPKPAGGSAASNCLGNSDCTCYKCKRQRRRAGSRARPGNDAMPSQQGTSVSRSPSPTRMTASPAPMSPAPPTPPAHQVVPTTPAMPATPPIEPPATPTPTLKRKDSFVLRKKPSIAAYEKHLPRPTYSEQESIYGTAMRKQSAGNDNQPRHDLEMYSKDTYEISWQEDETGEDILAPLRTFQSIFDEKPVGNDGLSDLLEHRTKELKQEMIRQQEIAEQQDQIDPQSLRPPPRPDCRTRSYRNGPEHRHLTLYHTMKMQDAAERMMAYRKALEHCVCADSGLAAWLDKHQADEPPRTSATYDRAMSFSQRKPSKRLLLPLVGRKQRAATEDMWHRTTKLASATSTNVATHASNPADVLSAADALMPVTSSVSLHQSLSKVNVHQHHQQHAAKPYDHVDTPSRPLQRARSSIDERSITSVDSESNKSSGRTGKLWSSLGRKASSRLKSHNAPASHHSDKTSETIHESNETFEKALDDLCEIMSHVDRAVLRSYLENANGDYIKTLSVIRADVTAGKL
ncbi:hypothetical protein BC940DRAFT_298926 [Gongronella butleri]|nr:hypothetical protein BC940DRAFT_298926 [Gongronella butleri]